MSDAQKLPLPAVSGDQPVNGPFAVVGVGASAGGLEAFSQLLSALSYNTGMAFVLVQHLDPKHESRLGDLLTKSTRMPVVEAAHGLAVQPDHVYIIPPNTTLTIAQSVLHLTPRGEARGPHLPIDQFFKSLAEDRQTGAVGVILSGTGTDGTLGLEEIKATGGITFAQDEQSAKYPGMPQSAIRSGCVDLVLSPEKIARELARISLHPHMAAVQTDEQAPPAAPNEEHFNKVLALLRSSFEVDFSAYRDTTIKRRITRRMVLHTQDNLAEYARHLEEDRAELDALYQDILISVTSFFRDPETFELLKKSVFPEILKGKSPNGAIRIWAPGCSTGQEAYSLAIALLEFREEKTVKPAIQIFATDLSDTVSLHKAREGIYPESIEAEVSPERLRRFFTKEDSKYRVSKAIRDLCVFARQNVAADPPFSRVDLISCRNLLIYLAPSLQKRVIPTFHYALNPVGFLVLGAAETVGSFTDLFGVVDQKHRIYVKKATAARQYPHFSSEPSQVAAAGRGPAPTDATPADWQRAADRIALGQYAPPGVLVNEDFDVLQYRGETGPYLAPAPGEPSHNLLKMARGGLFMELRAVLTECRQKGAAVRRQGVRVRGEGWDREIDLHVLPIKLPHAGNRCFLILFEETVRRASVPQEAAPEPVKDADGSEAALLRQELASTREYLQSIIEQQDVANEELKSANEEILSGNEELQSTNEELETSKEELQSINEELNTVNDQLQHRSQELSKLGDALTNLQASANVPMVELGIDLCIRRFTPAAAKVLNVLPGDVGRPIGNLKLAFEAPDLETLITEVIDTVQVKEREVRDRDGRWYALRIHPYRTADNRIDGAVAVFVDIEEIKSAQQALRAARDYAEAIVETVRDPLLVLDKELRVVSANEAFYRSFQVTPANTKGRFIYELGNRQWDIPELRRLLEHILPEKTVFQDFEVSHYFESIGRKVMVLNGRRIVGDSQERELILLAIEDITARKQAEAEASHSAAIVDSSSDAILSKTLEGVITSWNQAAAEMFGYAPDEIIGQSIRRLIPPERQYEEEQILARLKASERVEQFETERLTKTGQRLPVALTISPVKNREGKVIGASKVIRDITGRKQAEAALRVSENRFRRLFEAARDGILIINPQTRKIADVNPFMTELLGYTREELIGKELFEIGLLKDEQASRAAFRELQEKHFIRYEGLPLESKSGERREVEVVANLYQENSNEVIQCNIRDITKRKLLEDELLRITQELAEADRRKNEFLAMLAHELRNPLAPVRNGLAILKRIGSQDGTAQQTREMMERQVEHMARLLDDLLDISRITSGKIELHKARVELAELVRQVVETCRATVETAGQELNVQISAEPLILQADRVRLAQIVENLLANAIKYSDQGSRIELTVDREGNEAVLRLRDRGIGIAREMLARIWDLFVQAEPQSDRSRVGLGIGLTVVQNLVRLHGGSVEVHSAGPDQGSEFTVRLPLAKEGGSITDEKNIDTAGLSIPASSKRIVVVDDNRDEAESLGRLLTLLGHEVRVVHGGPAALEAAAGFRPAVIFLDIGMPGMSGYEVARRLRRDAGLDQMLIVALSGYGTAEDRRHSQEAGIDTHLVKPASLDSLQALLAEKR